MVNILLVRPQKEGRFLALSAPPLGLMYIASYLRRHAAGKVDIRILDLTVERNGREAMSRALDGFLPDIVGLSAMTPEAPDMTHFAGWFKQRFPEALIIAGGPHPNAAVEYVLRDENVDLICLGEGEKTALAMVDRLSRGQDVLDLPGLAYRKNSEIVINAPVEPIEDLDDLPFPARDLVPILDYCHWRVINPSISRHYKRFTTLHTSRACPYPCIFCHNIFGTRYRARSAQNVYQEMRELEDRYGIREFHIADDVFNLHPQRVFDLCDLIVEDGRDYRIAFASGLRGDILTEEIIDRLAAAGTYQISFGIESASDRIQKLVKKNIDISKVIAMIDYARRAGIATHGFFMFGFPTETREEMATTVKVALSANLVTAAFHTVAPYPGTGLFELLKQRMGDKEIRMEELFFKSSTVNLSNVSTVELHRTIKRVFRQFYLSPRRLFGIWRVAPRKIDVLVSAIFHMVLDPRVLRLKKWITGKTHY